MRGMAAAVLILLLTGCGGPVLPSASLPGASGSPSSPPVGDAHYAIDYRPGVRFDYPADWRIIAEGIEKGYQWIPVVMGTGAWKLNCTVQPASSTSGGSESCGADVITVGPAEIVVEMYTFQGPIPLAHVPPPTATLLSNGWRATVEDAAASSRWQAYVPGWLYPLTVDARFGEPGGADARADVRRLVETLRVWTPAAASAAPWAP